MIVKLSEHPEYMEYIKDDPVRPNIDPEWRIGPGREVYILLEDQYATEHDPIEKPLAILCVTNTLCEPINDFELVAFTGAALMPEEYTGEKFVVFYSVWSYEKGAGRQIVLDVASKLKEEQPDTERFITYSPKTEMARKFHLSNGAVVLQENKESVNYEYPKDIIA